MTIENSISVDYLMISDLHLADGQNLSTKSWSRYEQFFYDNDMRDYSVNEAMYDYRMYRLGRSGFLVSTAAAMPFTKEQIKLCVDVLVPRHIGAMLDHSCRALLRG